jgi:hypothetical protein
MSTLRQQIKSRIQVLTARLEREKELMKELMAIRSRVGWEVQSNYPFPIWFHLKLYEKDSYLHENLACPDKLLKREQYLFKKFEGLTLTSDTVTFAICGHGGE